MFLGQLRHGRVGRFLRAHPRLVDGTLAGLIGLTSWAALLNDLHDASPRGQLTIVILAGLQVIPLVWRRRYPAAVLATCLLISGVRTLLGSAVASNLGVLVAFYTVAATSTRRVRQVAVAAMAVSTVVASVAWWRENHAPISANLVVLSLVAITVGVLGHNAGTRRSYLAALTDRADRAERERDAQAQIAAATERARIAREMHDIVAHNLSVMIALADGAGFALDSSLPQARTAIGQVSRTGREALAEMRRLLGVLRADAAPASITGAGMGGTAASLTGGTAPQPRLADLDALVDQVRQAGLPVRLTITGKPLDLPGGMQLTVYRLVQEALTNTLRHAGPGATATVALHYDRRAVLVDVRDTGWGGTPPGRRPAGSGRQDPDGRPCGGQGLVGMRERSAVYGATVRAGPGPDGGWQVSTRIVVGGRVSG